MTIFREMIGKRINGIFVGNDFWTLAFRDTEGKWYRFDTRNDCCNSVWVNHINGVECVRKTGDVFDLIKGALVIGAEDKGWGENRSENDDEDDYGGDVIQDGFWTIHTDRGYIDIEVRNSHNGYYGGDLEESEDSVADVEDLKEITEDF
jgi:hypothetical protein